MLALEIISEDFILHLYALENLRENKVLAKIKQLFHGFLGNSQIIVPQWFRISRKLLSEAKVSR